VCAVFTVVDKLWREDKVRFSADSGHVLVSPPLLASHSAGVRKQVTEEGGFMSQGLGQSNRLAMNQLNLREAERLPLGLS
jgi:hypothetical protein